MKFVIADFVKLGSCNCLALILNYSQIPAYGNGSILMVAGYHNRSYAGTAALLDCLNSFRTNRVNHSGKSQVTKILLKSFGRIVFRLSLIRSHGTAQNTQRPVRHVFIVAENLFSFLIRHRQSLAVFIIRYTA